ncbi:MAG TPA: hypothetical protein DEP84_17515 [Chloroflexi bacterium]|nr:hypothetical protein [Chloroflexota bacterium]
MPRLHQHRGEVSTAEIDDDQAIQHQEPVAGEPEDQPLNHDHQSARLAGGGLCSRVADTFIPVIQSSG